MDLTKLSKKQMFAGLCVVAILGLVSASALTPALAAKCITIIACVYTFGQAVVDVRWPKKAE